jgi:hypothetical protein
MDSDDLVVSAPASAFILLAREIPIRLEDIAELRVCRLDDSDTIFGGMLTKGWVVACVYCTTMLDLSFEFTKPSDHRVYGIFVKFPKRDEALTRGPMASIEFVTLQTLSEIGVVRIHYQEGNPKDIAFRPLRQNKGLAPMWKVVMYLCTRVDRELFISPEEICRAVSLRESQVIGAIQGLKDKLPNVVEWDDPSIPYRKRNYRVKVPVTL